MNNLLMEDTLLYEKTCKQQKKHAKTLLKQLFLSMYQITWLNQESKEIKVKLLNHVCFFILN